MAMVRLASFLPSPHSILALGQLREPVTVYRRLKSIGGLTRLWLSSQEATISLTVGYHYVVFKFEVFELVVGTTPLPSVSDTVAIGQVSGWDTIRCLFRFEWERPAKPGEVPSNYVQIIGERGRRDEIPRTALAAGVTLVGIVFWNKVDDRPVAAILNDDDDPVTLRLLDSAEQMATAILGLEIVRPEDVEKWSLNLPDLRDTST